MRWKANPRVDVDQWHVWFAWHPVRTQAGQIVWMESVMRRRTERAGGRPYGGYVDLWEYSTGESC